MPKAQNRYIDSGSVDRGFYANQKSIWRWRNFKVIGLILFGLGVALIAAAVNEYSNFDLKGMTTVALVGVLAAAAGVIPYSVGKYMIDRFRLEDLNYRLALHFMREMGIPKAETVLSKNPRFLDYFEEVQEAVTAKQAENGGVSLEEQPVTRLAYRIASLVLRDVESLTLKSMLIALISNGADLDYDSLAATLEHEKSFF